MREDLLTDYFVGIDIGGTKVALCLGDAQGNIIFSRRMKTSSLGRADEGLPKIVILIEKLLHDYSLELKHIRSIGLACPGPLSIKEGMLITPPNLPGWHYTPIVSYLHTRLNLPIFMNNDANAGALAEWKFGSAKHVDHLIYLTMSTGMGGGIVINGKLLTGPTNTAGEVGHFVLDPDGAKCPCGQRGCLEVYCGGGNIARMLQDMINGGAKTKILDEAQALEKVDMKSLIMAVKRKDHLATKVWKDYIEKLAQGIGTLLMVLNPDAIILGTIAVQTQELIMQPLLAALPRFAWKIPLAHCFIGASRLGDKIGELGALALAIEGGSSYHDSPSTN